MLFIEGPRLQHTTSAIPQLASSAPELNESGLLLTKGLMASGIVLLEPCRSKS